jgi:hypothetical protein
MVVALRFLQASPLRKTPSSALERLSGLSLAPSEVFDHLCGIVQGTRHLLDCIETRPTLRKQGRWHRASSRVNLSSFFRHAFLH